MLKKVVLLAVLALALPIAAFADSQIDFNAQGGSLSGSSAGLTLTGSTLIAVNNYFGFSTIGTNLGTVSFTTGACPAPGPVTTSRVAATPLAGAKTSSNESVLKK